jgi:hypothetical protein
MQRELREYLELVVELTNFVTPLVERVVNVAGEPDAQHAGATILTRLFSELQACAHLVRLGYPPQAITIVGTMLELMHVGAYIGHDEVRAQEWMHWPNEKFAYPGRIADTIAAVALAAGASEADIDREYKQIYRSICQVKHGNSLAIGDTTLASLGGTTYFLVGPFLSGQYFRLAHIAMQWALRYALLGCVTFVEGNPRLPDRAELMSYLHDLSIRLSEVRASKMERFELLASLTPVELDED